MIERTGQLDAETKELTENESIIATNDAIPVDKLNILLERKGNIDDILHFLGVRLCQNKFIEAKLDSVSFFTRGLSTLSLRGMPNYYELRNKNTIMHLNQFVQNKAYSVFEKLIIEYGESVWAVLSRDEFRINIGKKMNQIVAIPDNIRKYITSIALDGCCSVSILADIQLLCDYDTNDVTEFVDEVLKNPICGYSHRQFQSYTLQKMLDVLCEIVKMSNGKTKTYFLVNYIMWQLLFRKHNSEGLYTLSLSDIKDGLITYRDYLNMSLTIFEDCEMYPSNLYKAEKIASRNYNTLNSTPDKCLEFESAAKRLERYETIGEVYQIVAPKTIADVVKEGTSLNHCVSSYTDKIIDGLADVVFVRKCSDPTVSFVTVEIDPSTSSFVQIKAKFDSDVTDENILKFLETEQKKWNRQLIKQLSA